MKQIPLTQGKFALVDDDMYDYLNQWSWFANRLGNTFYATRNEGKRPFRRKVFMHRVIMDTPKGMDTDHIDGNGLRNLRENLRNCTHAENARNRKKPKGSFSGFKGVSWHKDAQKYHARIIVDGKAKHLGVFGDPEEAARAYDKAAKEYFGEFANLNFQDE